MSTQNIELIVDYDVQFIVIVIRSVSLILVINIIHNSFYPYMYLSKNTIICVWLILLLLTEIDKFENQ